MSGPTDAAAKMGVMGLARTLALELGPHGIRVDAVCPGEDLNVTAGVVMC